MTQTETKFLRYFRALAEAKQSAGGLPVNFGDAHRFYASGVTVQEALETLILAEGLAIEIGLYAEARVE